ncbi:hypothetical protein ACFSSC_05185 [Corynebacterium mendelii]|uniref:Cobalamin biosynthesis protein CbiX n=1 Tax=Corynebacterium mendelii TaxID=2765362 RepID=A0A939IWN3_9CORY|nr:hypothetical protein [Corynebacterium mendelii]MBN9643208.1 hypothetical protein [Corynebacterium mendelii]
MPETTLTDQPTGNGAADVVVAVICGRDADAAWLGGFLQQVRVLADQQQLSALLDEEKTTSRTVVVVPATTGRNLPFITQTAATLRAARNTGGVRCVLAQPLGDATQVVSALKARLRRSAALQRAVSPSTRPGAPAAGTTTGADTATACGSDTGAGSYVVVVSTSIDRAGDGELVRQAGLVGDGDSTVAVEVAFDGAEPAVDDVIAARDNQPLAIVRADLCAPHEGQLPLWDPSSLAAVIGVRAQSALSRMRTHGTDGIDRPEAHSRPRQHHNTAGVPSHPPRR